MTRNSEIAELKATSSKGLIDKLRTFEINRQAIAREREKYGMQEVSSPNKEADLARFGDAQGKVNEGDVPTKRRKKHVSRLAAVDCGGQLRASQNNLKESEVANRGMNMPIKRLPVMEDQREVNVATKGVKIPIRLDDDDNQRDLTTTGSKLKEGEVVANKKKPIPKKLEFSYLQSTFARIGNTLNNIPSGLGEQRSTPAGQPAKSKSNNLINTPTEGNATDSLKRKLDAFRKVNNPAPALNVIQEPSSATIAQIQRSLGQQNNTQLNSERFQERQGGNPSSSSEGDASDGLKRKLDAIRKENYTMPSKNLIQMPSYAKNTTIKRNLGQEINTQVNFERIQEIEDGFPHSGSETEAPQTEGDILDQEGSQKGKGVVTIRATTIDEFLKEHGIDSTTLDMEGLGDDELSTEINGHEEDSTTLDKDYSKHVMADIDIKGDARKKKKTRGRTNCNDIYSRTMQQRELVTFDMGQPIGPTNQSVSNLTTFLGTIGRNKRFVSLLYTNWHAVPTKSKKFMWNYVNRKFILPEYTEKWAIQTIRDAWKRFKGRIKQKHFIPYDNVEDMVKNRPMQVPPNEFAKLILYWSHPLIQSISEKNKEHTRHQKFPHRMGPINFARVRAALRAEKGTNEEPKRFEMFIATRTNRKRKELDEATQHAIENFESRQATGETEEEAFQSLFGKEQPGRVRCYGRAITQSDLRRHAEVAAIKQQHQEEVSALQSKLGHMETKQQKQEENIQGLRKMVKLLLLRSEPEMRPEEIEALLPDAQLSPIDANSGHGSTHHVPNMDVDI